MFYWWIIKSYLKIFREPMLVIGIQLTDVFNELLDWNCFHIICRKKETFRVAICLIHKTSGEKVFTQYHLDLSSQGHS